MCHWCRIHGISTALHLAELGYSVTILEAQRIGFGASGRNGGQLGMGQRMDQDDLIDLLGDDAARVLWNMALDAQALVKSLINKFDIDCDLTPGVANLGHTRDLGIRCVSMLISCIKPTARHMSNR